MKKLLSFLVFFIFVLSSFALELSANGAYRIRMFNTWGGGGSDTHTDRPRNSWNFGNVKDGDDDDQFFDQRLRLKLTADNGNGIRGVIMFEMGDSTWGDKNSYARLGAGDGNSNVELLNAYIEINKWIYVKTGVFQFDSPNMVIFSEELAGILLGKDFNNFTVNFLYSRLYDGGVESRGIDNDDNGNLFGVMVPIKTHYFNVTPYFLFANIEHNAELFGAHHYGNMLRLYHGGIKPDLNISRHYSLLGNRFNEDRFHNKYKETDVWWIGAAFDGKLPYGNGIDWKLHGVYGSANVDAKKGKDLEMQGLLIDGSLTYIYYKYKFDMYGLYSSGFDADDYNNHELDLMPTVAPDYLTNGTYAPFFFDAFGIGCYTQDPSGYSMIGGQVTYNSIERLKHIFDVAYIWNMIDKDVAAAAGIIKNNPNTYNYKYMFDNFVQVALVNEYQIFEGTTLTMLAGALVPDANRDTTGKKLEDDTVYAINFKLQFNF